MAAKHGLGRGLGALIKEQSKGDTPETPTPGIQQLALAQIRKSSVQPRQHFDRDKLAELTASVRECGVLQPLLVRSVGKHFELIAGERRLRAAAEAGLREVPVVIMQATDHVALQVALIENLQRDDLNAIEEAQGYKALARKFRLTQEQIAQQVGKARASVANSLRLLDLPAEVKKMLSVGDISAGHAKALLGLKIPDEQTLLARKVVRDNLSVRALEKVIAKASQAPRKPRASKNDIPKDHIKHLSDKLHQHLGTGVRISSCKTFANGKKGKGTVEIDYYSDDDLDRILDVLGISAD